MRTEHSYRHSVSFENGYKLSIGSGFGYHGYGDCPYELAVLYKLEGNKYSLVTTDRSPYTTVDNQTIKDVLDFCEYLKNLS